ncbi:MAG: hypothetical protein KGJ86_08065, partial [Chloroflexota bacterium]|nr:hypothetical protein [Chloroflexota bacterium]
RFGPGGSRRTPPRPEDIPVELPAGGQLPAPTARRNAFFKQLTQAGSKLRPSTVECHRKKLNHTRPASRSDF